jgi:hypothetical protein
MRRISERAGRQGMQNRGALVPVCQDLGGVDRRAEKTAGPSAGAGFRAAATDFNVTGLAEVRVSGTNFLSLARQRQTLCHSDRL